MTELTNLCLVCFNELDDNGTCPVCRSDNRIKQCAGALPVRTVLSGRYFIGKALKHNSEGITYSAYDLKMNGTCSVREFYPDALVSRDAADNSVVAARGSEDDCETAKTSFTVLWNKLFRLRGLTSLVTVGEVFTENNTVYAVYDESERYTLRDYLLDTPEGYMTWERARILMMPVLSTLGTLHTSGIIHRGINPEAFIFSADGKLKLTDFCIEQTRTAASDLNAELFDGYSALEQYATTGQLGTWSDIYSFTAVLYRVLIGTTPIDARTRAQNDRMMIPAKFAEQIPPYVINAIINGMQLAPADRTRNVEQLRSNLSASPKAVNASAPVYGNNTQGSRQTPPPRTNTNQTSSQQRPPRPPVNNSAPTERVERLERERAEVESKSKNKSILIAVLCVILVILVGTGITLGIKYKNGTLFPTETTTGTEMVEVPTFIGFTKDVILNSTNYSEAFTLQFVEDASSEKEAGVILDQDIRAGISVQKGTVITLTVSKGESMFVLPDYSGYTFEQVEAELVKQGITCTRSEKYNDGTRAANTVIETYPGKGTSVKKGSTVIVVVWKSIEETTEYNLGEETTSAGNSVLDYFSYLFPSETTTEESTSEHSTIINQ